MINLDTVLHYMFFCHRLPERSFFFRGKQFPICARCTGILIGYIIGILYILTINKGSLIAGLILLLPTGIDGVGQYYGKWVSNNFRRLLTGILAGAGAIFMFQFACVLGLSNGKAAGKFLVGLIF